MYRKELVDWIQKRNKVKTKYIKLKLNYKVPNRRQTQKI